jgi:hypothetical protein
MEVMGIDDTDYQCGMQTPECQRAFVSKRDIDYSEIK